jgi:hypothetical protein
MFPQAHQEIARARHAELIREATQERLAAQLQEREQTPASPSRFAQWALRCVGGLRRRPAAHAA